MKSRSEFVCQQCGYKSPSFLGKCPECGEWNSLVETLLRKDSGGQAAQIIPEMFSLSDVKSQAVKRLSCGFVEFDRVLGGPASPDERGSRGGGIVPGSIVLISGDPGIGKSTLLLQCAMAVAKEGNEGKEGLEGREGKKRKNSSKPSESYQPSQPSVLYVTGEESVQQVKIRADRVVGSSGSQEIGQSGKKKPGGWITRIPDNLLILPETDVNVIVQAAQKISPTLLIIDSIQTLVSEELGGIAGSIGQVRQCAQILQRLAKTSGIPIFMVGHVNKEGNIAGPKVLEHLVDAVLSLEGDGMHAYRILRSIKNRFGSTFEVGVFEMADEGIVEVENASGIFLAERISDRPGSVVTATIAGGRPILAEVQALVSQSIFAVPTRRVTGLDISRTQVVIAALSNAAKLSLSNLDIFVNVAGGLKINEPSADLPCALSIISAVLNKPVREGICAFGEVGLLGEIRSIANPKSRLNEAKRLGFGDFVTPDKFKTLEAAVSYAIHGE